MVNWLDYKNYRLHGFKDDKWLIHHRVALFKKMKALRQRDLDVLQYNYDKEVDQEGKTLAKLKKVTTEKREEVRNALLGNRKMIYTTFSEHFKLFLAHGNSTPDDIAENLEQLIFNKRKMLDKYKYEKKKAMEKYKFMVLKVSELEDIVILEEAGIKSKDEKKMQEVSNTIQATRIRANGAATIRFTYTAMLRILCKDAIFYNVLLDSLDKNIFEQSKLIMDALEMGQTVNEYLFDLNKEVNDLELQMKINIVVRRKSLAMFYSRVTDLCNRLKRLARSETDILLPVDHDPKKTRSHTAMLDEVNHMEDILFQLQRDTCNPNFEAILPAYENQMYQFLRLTKFREVVEDYKPKLQRVMQHGEIMLSIIKHTYNKEKLEYLEKKRNLLKSINKQYVKDMDLDNFYIKKSKLILNIRNGMKNLALLLKRVEKRNEPNPVDSEVILVPDVTGETFPELVPKKLTGNPKVPFTQRLSKDEVDYLMDFNMRKMHILMDVLQDKDPPQKKIRDALMIRHNATMQVVTAQAEDEEIDLCAGMVFEDRGILTYKTAKIESAIYVADNTVDELALVAEQLKAMTKVRNPWVMAEMKEQRKKRQKQLKRDLKMRGEKKY